MHFIQSFLHQSSKGWITGVCLHADRSKGLLKWEENYQKNKNQLPETSTDPWKLQGGLLMSILEEIWSFFLMYGSSIPIDGRGPRSIFHPVPEGSPKRCFLDMRFCIPTSTPPTKLSSQWCQLGWLGNLRQWHLKKSTLVLGRCAVGQSTCCTGPNP